MEFGEHGCLQRNCATVVQNVANARKPTLSLGLRSPNEGTSTEAQYHWKKFIPSSAAPRGQVQHRAEGRRRDSA